LLSSIYLSIYLSINLSIYLSICSFTILEFCRSEGHKQGWPPLETPGEDLFPCLLQLLKVTCIPCHVVPSSHHSELCFCHHIFFSKVLPFPYFRGPLLLYRDLMSNLGKYSHWRSLIMFIRSYLPCKGTYSWVPGNRTSEWFSWNPLKWHIHILVPCTYGYDPCRWN
jgi:hypothetical protein